MTARFVFIYKIVYPIFISLHSSSTVFPGHGDRAKASNHGRINKSNIIGNVRSPQQTTCEEVRGEKERKKRMEAETAHEGGSVLFSNMPFARSPSPMMHRFAQPLENSDCGYQRQQVSIHYVEEALSANPQQPARPSLAQVVCVSARVLLGPTSARGARCLKGAWCACVDRRSAS